MDNKLMKTKEDLLKGEMQGLVFTEEMKRNVLAEISQRPSMSRQKKKAKNKTVPAALSFAAVTAFAIGMYYIISNGLFEEPNADKPPEETEIITPIEEEDVKENDNETEEETEENLPDDTVEEEPDSDPDKEQTDTETDQEIKDDQKQDEPVVVEPTKEELAGILNEFLQIEDSLFNTVSTNIKFAELGLKTKEDFYSYFYHLADKAVVEAIFSVNLDEREDGLYVIPMGGDRFSTFLDSEPYDFQRISDTEYHIIQELSSDFHGHYTITYIFTKQNGQWKLFDYEVFDHYYDSH
ncbi:hypothetical protein [Cytobacillus gottheilii]|uniref:Uncharacterized protein n=1 Tax=Cytobacillus gottheilii TaxID=859144 RepID=A0ABX8F8V7_9BACI|nr:hypothetical protein [Cytobacillus gottheilii]QVY60843.1 hypothetical protein J1899_17975 [Cytobacillus gottheilii]